MPEAKRPFVPIDIVTARQLIDLLTEVADDEHVSTNLRRQAAMILTHIKRARYERPD